MMRKLVSQSILFATVAALAIAAAGCSQYNGLKAKRTFRDANGLYQSSELIETQAFSDFVYPDGSNAAAYKVPGYMLVNGRLALRHIKIGGAEAELAVDFEDPHPPRASASAATARSVGVDRMSGLMVLLMRRRGSALSSSGRVAGSRTESV